MVEIASKSDDALMPHRESVQDMFATFRQELDARHDLFEKVVKISRDVTVESKRMIFHLHRVVGNVEEKQAWLSQAEEKKNAILKKLEQVALLLRNEDPLQFARSYSPGLQEFIEALALLRFLREVDDVAVAHMNQTVLSINSMRNMLTFSNQGDEITLPVPVGEFLLGLADVSGEAMRMCINSSANALGCRDLSSSLPWKLCEFVRILHDAFVIFTDLTDPGSPKRKSLSEKTRTMLANLKKCEDVCYTLAIRGQEMHKDVLKTTLLESSGTM